MRATALLIAAIAVGLLASSAHADDTLRCGSRLVRTGDGKDKVRAICGEPTSISLAGVVSTPSYYRGPYGYGYYAPNWMEVPVEVWTYNFGSARLLRKLRFVGDTLDNIESAGYGY